MEFAPGRPNGARENAKDAGKRIPARLMRAARRRGRREANRGMDGSVYATGFRSDVTATLIGRERKKRRGGRADEPTRPMNEPSRIG